MSDLPEEWQQPKGDLTAHDIRDAEFKVRMRGYDQTEVQVFLEKIASMVEIQRQEITMLKQEKRDQDERLEHFYALERHIQDAIILARKTAEEVVSQARKEADLILEKARLQARETENELSRIRAERDRSLLELRGLLQSQLAGLERLLEAKMPYPASVFEDLSSTAD